jgi:hypothetical protein
MFQKLVPRDRRIGMDGLLRRSEAATHCLVLVSIDDFDGVVCGLCSRLNLRSDRFLLSRRRVVDAVGAGPTSSARATVAASAAVLS